MKENKISGKLTSDESFENRSKSNEIAENKCFIVKSA